MSHRRLGCCTNTRWYHLTCVRLNIRSRARRKAVNAIKGSPGEALAGRIENNRYIIIEAGNYVTPWICRVSEHLMVSPDMCDA